MNQHKHSPALKVTSKQKLGFFIVKVNRQLIKIVEFKSKFDINLNKGYIYVNNLGNQNKYLSRKGILWKHLQKEQEEF